MKRTLICNRCETMHSTVEWGDDCPSCGAPDAMEFIAYCSDCKAPTPRSQVIELGTHLKRCYCKECTEERLEWVYAYKRHYSLQGV